MLFLFREMRTFILSILLFTLLACNNDDPIDVEANNQIEVLTPSYTRFDIQSEIDLFDLIDTNRISKVLQEVSGIVNGRKNTDVVYMHEDSGNSANVFVYDKKGNFKGIFSLVGINNRDWEDIAIGVGPIEGETYIYVADFGDNSAVRSSVRIYRFVEPELSIDDLASEFQKDISDYDIIEYQYPDGPRDAETLMLDALSKDLIIVTKREPFVHVYTLAYPQNLEVMNEAVFYGQLPLKRIVAGDISPDNTQLLLKDAGAIYLWNIEEDGPIKTMFNTIPERVKYIPEVQGEAVGWEHDGKGYFTISETDGGRAEPILYHYRLK